MTPNICPAQAPRADWNNKWPSRPKQSAQHTAHKTTAVKIEGIVCVCRDAFGFDCPSSQVLFDKVIAGNSFSLFQMQQQDPLNFVNRIGVLWGGMVGRHQTL
jgi:hypothetical protein